MDDWVEKIDQATGKIYYYNKKLRQTSWKKPTGSAEEAEAWVRRIDPASGDVYYYNTITQVRSAVNPVPTENTLSNETPELQQEYQRENSRRQRAKSREAFMEQELENSGGLRASLRNSLTITEAFPGNRQFSDGRTSGRRRVSLKFNQLQQIVKENAPGEDAFAKLRAMRRNYSEPEDGPTIDLAHMADTNNAKPVIAALNFEQYAAQNFNTSSKKMFGSKATLDQLMNFSDKPVKKGLLKLSTPAIEKKAGLASKYIHKFMENPSIDVLQVYKTIIALLNIAMTEAPQELRDDIFCQLIKQVRKNPRPESTFKGWQLLCLCCGAFPPSQTLEPTLRLFIDENVSNPLIGQANIILTAPTESKSLTIGDFAGYARLRLDKSVEVGPRSQIPSRQEVEFVMKRQPVTVSVYMVNSAEIKMQVDTWTTVKDLRTELGKHLMLKDISIFALIESCDDSSEYTLPLEDRILDILADWEIELATHKRPEFAPQNRLVFRIRLFFPIDPKDERAVELAYYQAVYDVTDGRYPTLQEDVVKLIALQAQEKFGDSRNQQADPFGNDDDFKDYVPEAFHENLTDIRRETLTEYASLNGFTQQEAMQAYVNIVQDWSFYGAQIFPVSPLNNPEFPKECYIAINAKAVYIIDPNMKKFLAEFSWDKIVTWGYSDRQQAGIQRRTKKNMEDSFCLIMGNFLQQTKLFFKTPQAVEVYKLVEAYGNRIKGYKGKTDK